VISRLSMVKNLGVVRSIFLAESTPTSRLVVASSLFGRAHSEEMHGALPQQSSDLGGELGVAPKLVLLRFAAPVFRDGRASRRRLQGRLGGSTKASTFTVCAAGELLSCSRARRQRTFSCFPVFLLRPPSEVALGGLGLGASRTARLPCLS
jgi:hypothetical protein